MASAFWRDKLGEKEYTLSLFAPIKLHIPRHLAKTNHRLKGATYA